MSIHYKETYYGFEYGSAQVTRLFSDEKKQWVTIGLKTPKRDLQICITKTGKVRIFNVGGDEWKG